MQLSTPRYFIMVLKTSTDICPWTSFVYFEIIYTTFMSIITKSNLFIYNIYAI